MSRFIHSSRHALAFALILFVGVLAVRAAEDQSKTVSLAELPAAAQKTVQAQAGSATLGDIERVEEDGEVSYLVEVMKDGNAREFTVAEDGVLLSIDVELKETPAAVQKTIKAQVGQGSVDSVQRTYDGGTVSYEVDMTPKGGGDRSFTVAADGKLMSMQIALEETPTAVRKTIETETKEGKLGDIFRIYDEGEISYDAEMIQDGRNRGFSVAANGKLESLQVFVQELPPLGQATLKEKVGTGKLLRIEKDFGERNDFMYKVESRKDGKRFDFRIGPGGRFRGVEQ